MWYQSSGWAWCTSWEFQIAPNKNWKQAQDTILEKPNEDCVVPSESIGEEEPIIGKTKMSPKVRRNNGARSYSPKINWKSSSRWIGLTVVSWLRPSKEEHPRMWGSNQPNPGISMVPVTKRLWTLSLRKWRIICMPPRLNDTWPWSLLSPTWKAMPPPGEGQWDKRKGRTMATFGSSLRNASRPNLFQGKELRLYLEVQTSWPYECHKWKFEAICEGLLRTHAQNPTHAWVGLCVPIRDGVSNFG